MCPLAEIRQVAIDCFAVVLEGSFNNDWAVELEALQIRVLARCLGIVAVVPE